MAILPITLTGANLKERHHQINNLVNDAYLKGIPFTSIKNLPEKSALDRLFKIDFASKCKDVDYIVENLKDEDMLYVSRALKCIWIFNDEYSQIINPSYLENILYPEMTTTAVNKMKHWIELNLNEPERNKEFYEFYKGINDDASIKFILKCSKDVIMSEVNGLLECIKPHHLKIMIEKCPDVAKVYFESLDNNRNVLEKFLKKNKDYYKAFKPLLKVNGDDFLDIVEKYFISYAFIRFSPEATKYILKNYKARFNEKSELYTSTLLDMKTLAKYLTVEEIKELILKLARARYMDYWFSYENVEPLIKKLSVEERTSFKKLVFVDKDVGDIVETCPYERHFPPTLQLSESNIFEDKQYDAYEYDFVDKIYDNRRKRKRRIMKKSGKWERCNIIEVNQCCARKSSLDQLFDRYRFVSFEKTFFDLRKQLKVETLQHRQNIILVLISKSGGRNESLEELLKFLISHHENEPEHFRATVIRSLVRRCCVWRVPQNIWEMVLKFGRGLGLDGTPSTVACTEGLHAVIIRHIILDQDIDPAVWKVYVEEFLPLEEYALNASEKGKILKILPELLITTAKNEPEQAVDLLFKALCLLSRHRMRIDKYPNLVKMISITARNSSDLEPLKPLLYRLFDGHVARKELFKVNFVFKQNDASYYNALKHDLSVLATGETFEALNSNELAHDRFIITLSLYFNEPNGLASKYLELLKKHLKDEKVKKHKIARYIAILSGESITDVMKEFNGAEKKSEVRHVAAALRANCHLTRPLLQLNAFDLKCIGAKAVANRVLKCSLKDVGANLQSLMSWERTQRLAFVLSTRIGKETHLLQVIGEKRPRVALKIIFRHLKTKKLDEEAWTAILSMLKNLKTPHKIHDRLREALNNTKLVPENRRKEYYVAAFEVFRKITTRKYAEMPMLCHIESILFEIDPAFIETVVCRYLNDEFTIVKLTEKDDSYDLLVCLHIRIIAKYLLLCKSDTEAEKKWKNTGGPFFDRFDEIWNAKTTQDDRTELRCYLNDFLQSLKYTKVFLDSGYGSCLTMFEKIVTRLQTILPMHRYFDVYISLHLSMLYFKTVRQSVKNNANVFEDLPKNLNDAAGVIGHIFGKYIASEAIKLIDSYFESIIEIYKVQLTDYLESYFEVHTETWVVMVTNIVLSLLENQNSKIHLLAVHIYKTIIQRYSWPEKDLNEVLGKLKASKNMEIIVNLSEF